jgi:hypothetical protein
MPTQELDLVRHHTLEILTQKTAEMVNWIVASLATWRTLNGSFGSPTRSHVIPFANTHEQRASHTVGHPNRSVGGPRKRKRQKLVSPQGTITADSIETGERLRLREEGIGARLPHNRDMRPPSPRYVAQRIELCEETADAAGDLVGTLPRGSTLSLVAGRSSGVSSRTECRRSARGCGGVRVVRCRVARSTRGG